MLCLCFSIGNDNQDQKISTRGFPLDTMNDIQRIEQLGEYLV